MNQMKGDLKVLVTSLTLVLIIDVSVMIIVVLMPTTVDGGHAVWLDTVVSGQSYRMYMFKFFCNSRYTGFSEMVHFCILYLKSQKVY